jgi:site-specific DNA-methyltransferase (adenine-specific)
MNKAMFSSEKDSWGTPQNIRNAVFAFARGEENVVDPCPGDTPVGEARQGDGLEQTWYIKPMDPTKGRPVVYVNPPYGREPPRWVQKAVVEAGRDTEILMLVPSRTDTQWFHQALHSADLTCFLRGRLTFLGAKNPAPFPSVVFYWGGNTTRFAEIFGALGNIVTPTERKNG